MQALFQPKTLCRAGKRCWPSVQVCCGRCGADAGRCWSEESEPSARELASCGELDASAADRLSKLTAVCVAELLLGSSRRPLAARRVNSAPAGCCTTAWSALPWPLTVRRKTRCARCTVLPAGSRSCLGWVVPTTLPEWCRPPTPSGADHPPRTRAAIHSWSRQPPFECEAAGCVWWGWWWDHEAATELERRLGGGAGGGGGAALRLALAVAAVVALCGGGGGGGGGGTLAHFQAAERGELPQAGRELAEPLWPLLQALSNRRSIRGAVEAQPVRCKGAACTGTCLHLQPPPRAACAPPNRTHRSSRRSSRNCRRTSAPPGAILRPAAAPAPARCSARCRRAESPDLRGR
jgi:hypothetical protein